MVTCISPGMLLRVLPEPFPLPTFVLRPPSEGWLRNEVVAWCVIAFFYAFLNLLLSPQLLGFILGVCIGLDKVNIPYTCIYHVKSPF